MSLYLPPQVQMDLEREAVTLSVGDQKLAWAREFLRELKALDPRLTLIWVKEEAPEWAGMVPGRWHVKRVNESGPDAYMAITGPNGEYMDPHSGIFEQLRQMDSWRGPSSTEKLWRKRTREAQHKAKLRESQREENREDLALHLKALGNPGVAFTDRPWTYRAGARHG